MILIQRFVKTKNQRSLRKIDKTIAAINKLSDGISAYDDEQLISASTTLRTAIRNNGAITEQHLAEAFAIVREASKRALGMYHYDVQLIGGVVLNQGKIAEMRTGEGKTLVATLAAYVNSALGQVHIVTVNDYLAKRDCEIVKPIFDLLCITSDFLQDTQQRDERFKVYEANIVYGTSSQFGFDYLRDNMILRPEDRLQKSHHYAIIDEADSVLIDEARTPLIISGNGDEDTTRYSRIMNMVSQFTIQVQSKEDASKDTEAPSNVDAILIEKSKSSKFTECGYAKLEKLMLDMGVIKTIDDLYSAQFLSIVVEFQTAFKAKYLYEKDVSYIVRDGKIEIIDENTGRIAEGRRWSDGLHQFIEAKENVEVNPETVSLGSITLQNYFKLYTKLSGMTGTADTDAAELNTVYDLDVVVIPTNKPIKRTDIDDTLYLTNSGKLKAIIADISTRHQNNQPILVGTASVEKSEEISNELERLGIPHNVLNAKNHEKEAMIIAQAGRARAVTIATNMAGRGTDIILGGNWKMLASGLINPDDQDSIDAIKASCEQNYHEVIASGGLHVIGTERHDSRRIDNQLRGRAGRQGDIGSSTFYVSLEDRVMRIYGGGKLYNLCQSAGLGPDEALSNSMIRKVIENAQVKIENHNYEQRKELIKFDEVLSKQRKEIYDFRNEVVNAKTADIESIFKSVTTSALTTSVKSFLPDETYVEQWDMNGLLRFVRDTLRIDLSFPQNPNDIEITDNNHYVKEVTNAYFSIFDACKGFIQQNGHDSDEMVKSILLQSIDKSWRENMSDMDRLQDGIHLRGYIQKDPKVEFARESIKRFSVMIEDISETFMINLFRTTTEYARLIQEQKNQGEAA
ncbi:MAG: preprotein translocase subunit SecA [Hafnia sp.]